MNCSDWQMRIAGEDAAPEVAEHLSACAECRRFASELEANATALRSFGPDAAAYAAVRARVMSSVRRKRRLAWLWPAAAVAVAAACVAVVWPMAALRREVPRPAAITYRIAPPELQMPVLQVPVAQAEVYHRPKPLPRLAKAVPERKAASQLTAIKMLTDDPDVVIIWLVNDEKQGGSL